MIALNEMRQLAMRFGVIYLWLHLPIVAGVAFLLGSGYVFPLVTTAVLVGAATASWKLWGVTVQSRYVFSVALIAMPALLVYQFASHPWQVDLHMYFFAALALLAAFCDWRVILLTTVAVALHHLALNFILPAAVFPGGASLTRVILHAVIVIVEAGTLGWLCMSLERAFAKSELAVDEAKAAKAESETLGAQKRAADRPDGCGHRE